MLILSKDDRLNISLKLVRIDKERENIEKIKAQIEQARLVAEKKDETNKKLAQSKTDTINPYQKERTLLNGIQYSELSEQEFLDSARHILGNTFFQNDLQNPTPSLSDGVWKKFVPFAGTHAIGKTRLEVYPATGLRTEQNIIDDISAKILELEVYPVSERISGKLCVPGAPAGFTCIGGLGGELDSLTCTTNGGVWTPTLAQPDTYISHPFVVPLLAQLEVLVQEWEDRLSTEQGFVPTNDPSTSRQTNNNAAIADIVNAKFIIDIWQAVQDFDTTTSLPAGLAGAGNALFLAMVESDFDQAKLSPIGTLQPLKNELTARTAYILIRLPQLDTNLGSVTQSLSTGLIDSYVGLYGDRMLFIDLRLNLMGGSLNQKIGSELGKSAQDSVISNNENAAIAYGSIMTAAKTLAPGLGNNYVTIKTPDSFLVNDRVYVVSDNQEELSGVVDSIVGQNLKLSFIVPKKYTTAKNLRIYKLI